ncbi:hypothetical protein F66182_9662 [Fusarium sp. NRRL 66182]|nr:hypothetical protein F66182_9662 [Fusarium sp. NRRL 66182]
MDHDPALIRASQTRKFQHSHSLFPSPATIIAIAIVLLVVSVFISVLHQLLERRLAERRGWFLTTACPSDSHRKKTDNQPISEREIEARQHLFGEAPLIGEQTPLRDPNERGSLYDTFQQPAPHALKLKNARSMMEFNGGHPLEGQDEKGHKKAKTIHWHGVNRLNTAWGWMS